MDSCTFLFRKPPKLLMHQPRICAPLSQPVLQAGMAATFFEESAATIASFSVILGYSALLLIVEVRKRRS